MLGSTCPLKECSGTPLMKDSKDPNGFMMCVSCDGKYQSGHGGATFPLLFLHYLLNPSYQLIIGDILALTAPVSFEETLSNGSAATELPPLYDISDAPILNLADNNDRDPSVQISKYLIKGWALLDEVFIRLPLVHAYSHQLLACKGVLE